MTKYANKSSVFWEVDEAYNRWWSFIQHEDYINAWDVQVDILDLVRSAEDDKLVNWGEMKIIRQWICGWAFPQGSRLDVPKHLKALLRGK